MTKHTKDEVIKKIMMLSEEECKQLYIDAYRAGLIKEAIYIISQMSDEQVKQLMQTFKEEQEL